MYRWQYNGVTPWIEIVDWCYEKFGKGNFVPWHETIYFQRPEDLTLFLLRWS